MSKLLVVIAVAAGCAVTTSYVYKPQGANTLHDGYRSIEVEVPSEAPHGSIELASFGIIELTPGDAESIATLHVRLVVSNLHDDVPWTLNTQGVTLEIASEPPATPLFVNADLATLPVAIVTRAERRVFDFYYAVPEYVVDEDDLAAFDIAWHIATPSRAVDGRTHFARDAAPRGVELSFAPGWGPFWWCAAAYQWSASCHQPDIIESPPLTQVRVTRFPHWQRGHGQH